VLHFAGHTAVDGERPWRTRLPVQAAASEERLTAGELAEMRLAARLVVLASCRTAGSRVLAGEGLLGLSAAFLAAGAPTVVATLWPVDDRATGALVRDFYAALADGATAGEALRRARLERRADPATAAPLHWAGFVLVGDPETRAPLGRRALFPWRLAPYGLAGLGLLALGLARRGWRRAGRTEDGV
jgi:CHAT domain-containing protein